MSDDDEREEASVQERREDEGAEASSSGARAVDDSAPPPEPLPRRRPAWMMAGRLLLAPLLAAVAVGVHWKLNVPERITVSPSDQGSKGGKDKARRKSRAARSERRAEQRQAEEPRAPEVLEQDWERYGSGPFEDEPTRPGWARRRQAFISRAVVMVRRSAFEGAPEKPHVELGATRCRTVRCRFVLRSPYRHELDTMAEALARLQSNDQDVWRSYERVVLEAEDGQEQLQVTVAFVTDELDSTELALRPMVEVPSAQGEPAPADEPSGA